MNTIVIGIALLRPFGRSIVGALIVFVILGHPKCSQSRALVLNRYIDSEGRLVTKRLHVIYQEIPSFVKAIIGDCVTYAGEESVVDPKTKTLTLRTKNLSLTSLATIDELCTYTACTSDPEKTEYTKELSVQGLMGGLLNSNLEKWYVATDNKNLGNGKYLKLYLHQPIILMLHLPKLI